MRSIIKIISCLVIGASIAGAEISPTYPLEVKLDLCPEYALGSADYKVRYRVKGETQPRIPDVVSSSVSGNKAVVEIAIPRFFTSLALEVYAQCFNQFGDSPPSNLIEVNNCQALELLDSDNDILTNAEEDTNCDGFYSPGDYSNPEHVDSDGDGVTDLSEFISATDPTNRASSPRPYIVKSAPFDIDNDGNSEPLIWRPSNGRWYIKTQTDVLESSFGQPGDVPFTYLWQNQSDIGVIRRFGGDLVWFFSGVGFAGKDPTVVFGQTVDWIIPGQWESPNYSNPAIARVFYSTWFFSILNADGSVTNRLWGSLEDLPKPGDYDGDGVFDIAVYRQSDRTLYYISSIDQRAKQITFGQPIWDPFVQGDYSGDGIEDLTFWEPQTGTFRSLRSETNFVTETQLQLGVFFTHLPLNWTLQNNKLIYTVVDHFQGLRFFRRDNNPTTPPESLNWGTNGDAQG